MGSQRSQKVVYGALFTIYKRLLDTVLGAPDLGLCPRNHNDPLKFEGVQDLIFLRPPKAVGNISHGRQNNGGRFRCDSIITLMMEDDDFFN